MFLPISTPCPDQTWSGYIIYLVMSDIVGKYFLYTNSERGRCLLA